MGVRAHWPNRNRATRDSDRRLMLTRLSRWVILWIDTPMWTQNLGIARTLIAVTGLATLAFNSMDTLIRPGAGIDVVPNCAGPARISAWCVVDPVDNSWMQILCILILALAASGWRPRLTAIPMWWVLFSNQASFTTVDGGDQVAAVLALLLIPVSLTDSRRFHWRHLSAAGLVGSGIYAGILARVTLVVIKVQVSFIYINACLSKLSVAEWLDGTSIYCWLRDPLFGPVGPLRQATDAMMLDPVLVASVTWGTLMLEFLLGISLFLPQRTKYVLLPLGVAFHLGIAVTMGLWTFAFAMWGALLLSLWPQGRLLYAMIMTARRIVEAFPRSASGLHDLSRPAGPPN
ncbi:sporulation-delaying protein SdpB family protein [Rhodoglobus aureus]